MKDKNIIQVFEHQKIRIGYEDKFTQASFDALLKYNEKHKNKYFDIGYRSVKFKEYVGVIQIGKLTIEILPKAENNNSDNEKWRTVLLNMLKETRRIQSKSISSANLKKRKSYLLDLYFEIFVSKIEYLLRTGLVKQYRKNSGNLTALKGGLNFTKHLSNNLIHKERFYTNHTIYDRTHLLHKIIFKTLIVLNKMNNSSLLENRITRLLIDFPEMENIKVTEATFEKIRYNRKTEQYKSSIEIAKFILLNYSPDIVAGKNNLLAILFDMNQLWEEYVLVKLKKYSYKIDGLKIFGQDSKLFWKSRTLRPDIIVEKDGEEFVIDTKWKNLSNSKPTIEDLRQIFAYNEYWNKKDGGKGGGILLYPEVNGLEPEFASYKEKDHFCKIEFIQVYDNENFAEEIINKL